MNECAVGQIMNIQSAEAGYSQEYSPNTNPPQCYSLDCTRSIDTPVRLCNGRRACSISQEIVIYPQGLVPALCSHQRDGNFIRIQFTCVNGAFDVNTLVPYCILCNRTVSSFILLICTPCPEKKKPLVF